MNAFAWGMTQALTVAALGGLGVVVYVYFGYPLLLAGIRFLRGASRYRTGDDLPTVTLVIPAYNEAKVIREKLENSLRVDYPRDRFEVIVASDGSDDGTDIIAQEFEKEGVKLLASRSRSGKISALNLTVPQARGEIIVLCDANVMFLPDAVRRLVRHFADPAVGAVTGDVRIRSADAPFGEGEGLYYMYERRIQLWESDLGSVIGVDGGLYALRKILFRPLAPDTILDDFVLSMQVALSGHRVLYDPSAVATENATLDVRQEFNRKVRIVAGGWKELLRRTGVPGPGRFQLFWSYCSHKLLRWLVPWFLLVVFVSSAALALLQGRLSWPAWLTCCQILFYGLALAGCTRPNARWPAPVGIPFYFCMVNAAAWVGSLRGLLGRQPVTWNKADR
jgi:cellulose synthase/poly-beta-1,6-N-acetylglucosamine synthase-like glycosyltransferase